MVSVWHQSSVRAIWKHRIHLLSYRSRCTLMSYTDHFAQHRLNLNAPIDMRALGTQKLWQKPCAHTKQKHKHIASKTESLAMCKTGNEHTANNETHKPCVHTTHDKHESTQPMKNTSCVSHRTRQNKRKHNEDNECTRTEERECPNPDTKPELGLKQYKSARIRTPHSNMKQST